MLINALCLLSLFSISFVLQIFFAEWEEGLMFSSYVLRYILLLTNKYLIKLVQKSQIDWLLVFLNKTQTQKGSKERLLNMTRTHNMQIWGEIPFVKPQNDT